jgi:hypothetical protein
MPTPIELDELRRLLAGGAQLVEVLPATNTRKCTSLAPSTSRSRSFRRSGGGTS